RVSKSSSSGDNDKTRRSIATPAEEKCRCLPSGANKTIRIMRNIGINGFGPIGRLVFRAIVEQGLLGKHVAVVALNDLVSCRQSRLRCEIRFDSGSLSSRSK